MKTVCAKNMCAGCMACIDICPKGAIKIKDELSFYNAVIEDEKCIHCGACYKICQRNNPPELVEPLKWYQGWAQDQELRKNCSSGGFATAISKAFIESGGVVCACTFSKGKFIFEFAEHIEEIQKFVGSKYVKSNPAGVYKETRDRLKKGQKVLFIGLPCQVSALRNFIVKKQQDNLYTMDLICHGTPSPELLEIFLKQYGYSLTDFNSIQFREKAKFQIFGNHKGIIPRGVSDRYSIAFLNSLIYTENCYSCVYSDERRISDLTLGDSWGSELEMEEQKKGVSLALCQTEKGAELLEMSCIHLEPVNIDRAIANNEQLDHPSVMPKGYGAFFRQIKKYRFNSVVFWQLPKQCLRQNVKEFLIRTKIIRRRN